MASGELISIDTVSPDWVTNEDTIYNQSIGRNATLSATYYIAAPVFRVYYKINHTGLGSSVGHFYAYKWIGSSNYFESTPTFRQNPQKGIGSSATEFVFAHNWNEGTNNESDIHIWKIVFDWQTDDGWFAGTDCKLTIKLGSVAVSTQPHMYQRGSKIYCCPCIYRKKEQELSADEDFIVLTKPSSFRGDQINTPWMAYAVQE